MHDRNVMSSSVYILYLQFSSSYLVPVLRSNTTSQFSSNCLVLILHCSTISQFVWHSNRIHRIKGSKLLYVSLHVNRYTHTHMSTDRHIHVLACQQIVMSSPYLSLELRCSSWEACPEVSEKFCYCCLMTKYFLLLLIC